MHKTLVGMTTINGFTFIIVVAIIGCQVSKVFVLNKSRFGVVPNSSLFSGWSLLPRLFKVLTGFSLTCHFGIRGHPCSLTKSIVPNVLIVISRVFNSKVFNSLIGF
jgi:hypothetical protein